MGGKGSNSNTTVQRSDPWEKQMPYLSGGRNEFDTLVPGVFPEAAKLYKFGQLAPDYYKGNTVAPQSKWTTEALRMQADRALNGDASISTAKGALDNITSGKALAGNTGLKALEKMTEAVNPYSSALLDDAIGQASADIDSGFSSAGRYGSGAHENARADAVADLTSQFYSDAYDKQLKAASEAGELYNTGTGQRVVASQAVQPLANQAYTDAAALSEAGGVMDDYKQALINADIDRYNYNAQQALTALSNYNALIQGSYGGTTTSTAKQDGSGSRLGNVVGGATTGASIGSAGGPWGAAAGGVIGGLLGLIK